LAFFALTRTAVHDSNSPPASPDEKVLHELGPCAGSH
jgi:hypothetical protein